MISKRAVRFVRLYHKDDLTGPLGKSLRSLKGHMNDLARHAKTLAVGVAALGAAAAVPIIASIKAASQAQETMSKFNVVFGKNADAMKKWGDEFSSAVGRGKTEVAGFLAGTQDLLVPLGLAGDEAEAMSKKVVQLAYDLGSFQNVADDDALRDLHAALTGSGEVMKKYGVVVNEARVKQELLNMKLDPKTATEAQKAMARFNIILAGTTAAQGDAIRTSDSFANSWKRLKATIFEAAVELGEKFLPFATQLVSALSEAILVVGNFGTSGTGAFDSITVSAEILLDTIGMIGNAFNGVAASIAFLRSEMALWSAEANEGLANSARMIPGKFGRAMVDELEGSAKELRERAEKLRADAEKLRNRDFRQEFQAELRKQREEREKASRERAAAEAGDQMTAAMRRDVERKLRENQMQGEPAPATPAPSSKAGSAVTSAIKGAAAGLAGMVGAAVRAIPTTGVAQQAAAGPTILRGTGFAPTFSAAAAEAGGFRGASSQQRTQKNIEKSGKEAVDELKKIVSTLGQLVAGLVFG